MLLPICTKKETYFFICLFIYFAWKPCCAFQYSINILILASCFVLFVCLFHSSNFTLIFISIHRPCRVNDCVWTGVGCYTQMYNRGQYTGRLCQFSSQRRRRIRLVNLVTVYKWWEVTCGRCVSACFSRNFDILCVLTLFRNNCCQCSWKRSTTCSKEIHQ